MKKYFKIFIPVLIAALLLFSFPLWAENMKSVRENNKENLKKLKPGMSIREVLTVMGTETRGSSFPIVEEVGETITDIGFSFLTSSQTVRNPYRTQVLQHGRNTTEVFYYYTNVTKKDGEITDDELTPVVFENGVLVGWGNDFVKECLRGKEFFAR